MALGARMKVASTDFGPVIVNEQSPLILLQEPLQPENADTISASGIRFITVLTGMVAGEQIDPLRQDISPLTEPPPVPASESASEYVCIFALQLASVPPELPWQLHLQGSVPDTAVAVPVVQKLVVGAVVNVPPLLVPQAPLTGDGI